MMIMNDVLIASLLVSFGLVAVNENLTLFLPKQYSTFIRQGNRSQIRIGTSYRSLHMRMGII